MGSTVQGRPCQRFARCRDPYNESVAVHTSVKIEEKTIICIPERILFFFKISLSSPQIRMLMRNSVYTVKTAKNIASYSILQYIFLHTISFLGKFLRRCQWEMDTAVSMDSTLPIAPSANAAILATFLPSFLIFLLSLWFAYLSQQRVGQGVGRR